MPATTTSRPTCATCGSENVAVDATDPRYCICRTEDYSRRVVRMAATLDRKISEAVHTACAELAGAHRDDIADCVYGTIGAEAFDANETAITEMIRGIVG